MSRWFKNEHFCDRLKQARTEMNLTQEELAEKLNVDRNTVSNWECGKTQISIEILIALVELTHTDGIPHTADWFICSDETEHSKTYWDNVTDIYAAQRLKGIGKYGMTLENNQFLNDTDKLTFIQEELVDALMYLEWLKDSKKNTCSGCAFNKEKCQAEYCIRVLSESDT